MSKAVYPAVCVQQSYELRNWNIQCHDSLTGLDHFCFYTLPLNKEQIEFVSLIPISLYLGPKPKKYHVHLSLGTLDAVVGVAYLVRCAPL